ncbi:peptidylprolyl isomerase [Flagellimonas sp. HMM57]|uniref:peptidylprolyl isomerase n=1 Tax=unclassified Flagellimonas TaxID=2644544 RepID=UPI0013D28A45|nr:MULTISPECIES: peptidylprolyl isomerase [unclassified Flagellimonas]MBS9463731.1 peptidylprolyl isomerase [Flagellimonas sp. 389]UII76356.1 peptidylprolyl isomerase [Flagellimonas sp. HMM57]
MMLKQSALLASILLFLVSCGESSKKKSSSTKLAAIEIDSTQKKKDTVVENIEEAFVLTEENAIDFFFDYAKELKKDKVKLTTSMGSFTVQLYDNVPYHKANFIYLTEKGYFDNTQFHRIVKKFIIQGGNSDDIETARKRTKIGRYLLPPDAKKGHKHHRGVISMPSSERDNPHMLASPYEFFIVVTKPGSYHLDGSYTPFGKVISGMDIVDKINNVAVGDGDWPLQNVYILKAEVL